MTPENMTPAQLAGQRLLIGFDGTEIDGRLADRIARQHVAGVVLFRPNLATPRQIRTLCADLQRHARQAGAPPLIIAIDQEGGPVSRLPAPFTQFAGNPAMTGEADADAFARTTAGELNRCGITTNLAPVLDLAAADGASVMAARAFGADPAWVTRLGLRVIEGLQRRGVTAVAKHFPGIGRTQLDSHLALPVMDASLEEMRHSDLLPFEHACRVPVDGVMLSHILYPQIDAAWPASLSPAIARDLLRSAMGYDGVVMTDDLDMGAVTDHFSIETALEQVLASDVDLALICHEGPTIDRAVNHATALLEKNPALRSGAVASVRRVQALKSRYRMGARPPSAPRE